MNIVTTELATGYSTVITAEISTGYHTALFVELTAGYDALSAINAEVATGYDALVKNILTTELAVGRACVLNTDISTGYDARSHFFSEVATGYNALDKQIVVAELAVGRACVLNTDISTGYDARSHFFSEVATGYNALDKQIVIAELAVGRACVLNTDISTGYAARSHFFSEVATGYNALDKQIVIAELAVGRACVLNISVSTGYDSRSLFCTELTTGHNALYLLSAELTTGYDVNTALFTELPIGYDAGSLGYLYAELATGYEVEPILTLLVTSDNHIRHNEIRIETLSITDLNTGYDKYAWSASIVLTNNADWRKIKIHDPIELQFGDESYILIVESKGRNWNEDTHFPEFTLSCVSPSLLLDNGEYPFISKTWRNTLATDIVRDILPDGWTLEWSCVDWILKEFVVSDKSIMATLRELVDKLAIVQTSRSGYTLQVKPFHRHPVEDWGVIPIPKTHQFSELDSTLSFSVNFSKVNQWHSLEVGDAAEEKTIEQDTFENTWRLYPIPFRPLSHVETTQLTGAYASELEYCERIEEVCELVIKDGKASLSFPIYDLELIEFINYYDLGMPYYDIDGKELIWDDVTGHSICHIRYRVRYWRCYHSEPTLQSLQLVALEIT